jgi:O-methyltransferase
VSPGGYVIVDDYGAIAACRQAAQDFRHTHGIPDTVGHVDWTGASWRRA